MQGNIYLHDAGAGGSHLQGLSFLHALLAAAGLAAVFLAEELARAPASTALRLTLTYSERRADVPDLGLSAGCSDQAVMGERVW